LGNEQLQKEIRTLKKRQVSSLNHQLILIRQTNQINQCSYQYSPWKLDLDESV